LLAENPAAPFEKRDKKQYLGRIILPAGTWPIGIEFIIINTIPQK
jgi:hypothetical protein